MIRKFGLIAAVAVMAVATVGDVSAAEKKYGPGVSDTEIKIGQTVPYSGPASAFSSYGRVMSGYFKMINEAGGINGRKINLISLDNAFSPPKAIEQTRKLVEQDEVLAIIGSLGTPTNSAIQKYLNSKKIPHILVSSGASKWNDPAHFPWTTPFYPNYDQEAKVYGKYVVANLPDAKIGVGPILNGVAGRSAATSQGYGYSLSLTMARLTWNEQTLASFLRAPSTLVPGTRMSSRRVSQ